MQISVHPMELVAPALLSAACIAYNNTLNRWPPFQGISYVPLNLALAMGAVIFGLVVMDLSGEEIGLQGDAGDAWRGALAAVLITAPIFAVALSHLAHRVADRRVATLKGSGLAYQVLVRIPLGTAVTEEVVFRGVLFASWRAAGLSTIASALVAAAGFGLWHVAPTINLMRANSPEATPRSIGLSVLGAVAFTTAAGLALTWVRLKTGGLVAPIVLHAGTNSLGTLAAVLAARRSGRAGK